MGHGRQWKCQKQWKNSVWTSSQLLKIQCLVSFGAAFSMKVKYFKLLRPMQLTDQKYLFSVIVFPDLGVLEYRISFCRGETLDFSANEQVWSKRGWDVISCHIWTWLPMNHCFLFSFVRGWQAPELSVWCLSHLKQTSQQKQMLWRAGNVLKREAVRGLQELELWCQTRTTFTN